MKIPQIVINFFNPKSVIISKQFSCILLFAWIFGCFPIKFKHLFTGANNENVPFYKNPMILYNLGFILSTIYTIMVCQEDWLRVVWQANWSTFLIVYLAFFILITTDFLSRIYLLMKPSTAVQLIKAIRSLDNIEQARARPDTQKKPIEPCTLAYIAITMGFIRTFFECILAAFVWAFNSQSMPFWGIFRCHLVLISSFILTTLETGCIVLIGSKLIEIYNHLVMVELLGNQCPKTQVLARFNELKQAFHLYSNFVGILVLTNISQSCFTALHTMYLLVSVPPSPPPEFDQGEMTNRVKISMINISILMNCIYSYLTLLAVVNFGEHAETVINLCKDRIHGVLAETKLQVMNKWAGKEGSRNCAPEETLVVAKCILSYNWKLNAFGLFNVNYKLLLTVRYNYSYKC